MTTANSCVEATLKVQRQCKGPGAWTTSVRSLFERQSISRRLHSAFDSSDIAICRLSTTCSNNSTSRNAVVNTLIAVNALLLTLVVHRRWVTFTCSSVLIWVFLCCSRVQRTVDAVSAIAKAMESKLNSVHNILYFLLCPFQISLDVFGSLHTLCKVGSGLGKPLSSLRLQFHQFAVLRIQFSGPCSPMSAIPWFRSSSQRTHICACFAKFLSRGIGL